MNDKIGELIARSRYWSERAAHHTDRGAALRCAARADLLKQAIEDELGYALCRMSASPREVQLELPLLLCAWSVRRQRNGEVNCRTQSVLSRVDVDTFGPQQ